VEWPHDALVQNHARLSVVRTGVSGPRTTITFKIQGEAPENVRVRLFDMHGRLVATLLDGRVSSNAREITFNGLDNRGRTCPPGLYVCEMTAGQKTPISQAVVLDLR
jgi:flagellar hook assembly protein FlgD